MPARFAELGEHDAYDLLGVATDASPAQIRSAFRRQVKQVHPDVSTGQGRDGTERLRLLEAARDILLGRRAAYDDFRRGPRPGEEPLDAEIIEDPWETATQGPPPDDPWAAADPGPHPPPYPQQVFYPPPEQPLYQPMPPPSFYFGPPRRRGMSPAGKIVLGCVISFWVMVYTGCAIVMVSGRSTPQPDPSPALVVSAPYAGEWEGNAKWKRPSKKDVRIRLTLRQGNSSGQVRYDDDCQGGAILTTRNNGTLTISTVFPEGQPKRCEVGDFELSVRKDGNLNLTYRGTNGTARASAVLHRR